MLFLLVLKLYILEFAEENNLFQLKTQSTLGYLQPVCHCSHQVPLLLSNETLTDMAMEGS